MQSVSKSPELCFRIMSEMDMLYADLSEIEAVRRLIPLSVDERLSKLVSLFVDYGYVTREYRYVTNHDSRLDVAYDPKNMIVCFSGGKDSFATALHYKRMGYNVYLYHLRGLNQTYRGKYSEHLVAEEGAKYLGLPLIIEDISYTGFHEWVEHPMKNILLANRALSYGVRNGLTTKIAVGTFRTSKLKDNEFSVCGGDCADMWDVYNDIIKTIIPNFHVYIPNINYQTSYNVLLKDPKALEHTVSCMTPTRFRDLFRNRTEKNYSIRLLPNRCGCCWKDCIEYIWFTDHGVFELNPDYYIHCLEVLGDTYYKEAKIRLYTIDDIWRTYIFYPMTKSKMYKELTNAFIQPNGKIDRSNNDTEG